MSDTPRTDNEVVDYDYLSLSGEHRTGEYVDSSFARQLERELNTERQRREKAESEIAKMLVRVNGRSDESESCPFCTRISMDATSQQCPMCHLCEIESSLETERQRAEKASK